jgi:Transient receptor potential (TRP) ion channel/ML-like domain
VLTLSGAIYYIPDLDAKVRVWINDTTTGQALACVEAELSNGKTVHQKGVEWTIAVIAIIGLITAAFVSGLGHSNAATHVCSNAMSLFSYFQAQALIGMTAVSFPPIVRAWTQNFQWSMGLISVGFLQKMATWYQRATGGKPSSYLSQSATTSVQVQKRSLDALSVLEKRSNSLTSSDSSVLNVVTVKGIVRAGYLSHIEKTNIFFTAYTFFVIFVLFVTIGVVVFKYACEALVRAGRIKQDRFHDFRNGWRIVLKGILFRVVSEALGPDSSHITC